MTQYQEALAQKVIEAHKESNGILDWNEFFFDEQNELQYLDNVKTNREKYEQMQLIRSLLEEMDLIELLNELGTKSRLRIKGFAFESFDDERKKKAVEKRNEQVKSWPQRRWYLVALITFLIGDSLSPIRNLFWQKILPTSIQSKPSTPAKADSTLKNYKIEPLDSFSKNTIEERKYNH